MLLRHGFAVERAADIHRGLELDTVPGIATLLAAGPVGAGITLEYPFSTVNNKSYGCGSKVTHNLAGLFGVMQGARSALSACRSRGSRSMRRCGCW